MILKLLFINEYKASSEYGGVQNVTFQLMNSFLNHKIESYSLFFRLNKNNEDVINSDIRNFQFPSQSELDSSNFEFLNLFVKKYDINVIINQFGFNTNVLQLCSSLSPQCRIISVLHSCPDFQLKDLKMHLSRKLSSENSLFLNLKIIFKRLYFYYYSRKVSRNLKLILEKSTSVVLLSDYYVNVYEKITKMKSHNLVSIPNPISDNYNSIKCNFLEKKKEVIFVGRLNKGKRVNILLDIWKEIELENKDWTFSIVGEGAEFLELKAYAKTLGLKKVVFHGHQQDVIKFYKSSSIFLMSSAYEGFPMVLLEASALGVVPVVYNTFESIKDLVVDNKTGFIVDDMDITSFVNKVQELINNNEKLGQFSSETFQKSKEFSSEKIIKKWIEILAQ